MSASIIVPSITEQIKAIRQEIFRLAKHSPSIEVIHWYMWLDDCFENDEFSPSEFNNVQWRCYVLDSKKQPIDNLLGLISRVLFMTKCIDWQGKPIVKGLDESREEVLVAGTIFLGKEKDRGA